MSTETLTFDEMLSNMSKAMDNENFWDAEAYANMAIDYLDSDGPNSSSSDLLRWKEEELRELLYTVRDTASSMSKAEREAETEEVPMDEVLLSTAAMLETPEYTAAEKEDLINQIVNFKG
jgi:hypothetical protein